MPTAKATLHCAESRGGRLVVRPAGHDERYGGVFWKNATYVGPLMMGSFNGESSQWDLERERLS